MHSDPLAQSISEIVLHDGSDPDCAGICNLGALPDESRADHVARLRERYRNDPLVVDTRPGRISSVVLVSCPACTKQMPVGGRCMGCLQRGKPRGVVGARRLADGRLVCRRCGEERRPNHPCYACDSRTKRRASA